ncbi:MAG: hypothetical protein HFI50_11405 [Lachnospiraceae bacterium]|nr:hypothetical protein [Lachnospiraceae bacterium]
MVSLKKDTTAYGEKHVILLKIYIERHFQEASGTGNHGKSIKKHCREISRTPFGNAADLAIHAAMNSEKTYITVLT